MERSAAIIIGLVLLIAFFLRSGGRGPEKSTSDPPLAPPSVLSEIEKGRAALQELHSLSEQFSASLEVLNRDIRRLRNEGLGPEVVQRLEKEGVKGRAALAWAKNERLELDAEIVREGFRADEANFVRRVQRAIKRLREAILNVETQAEVERRQIQGSPPWVDDEQQKVERSLRPD